MFRHVIRLAFRNLIQSRFFAISTVVGLSVTLACSIYVIVFVKNELGYDRKAARDGNVFRILMESPIFEAYSLSVFDDLPEKLDTFYPEVVSTTFVSLPGQARVQLGDDVFVEKSVIIADSNFINVIQFDLVEGDREHCLELTNSALISERLALKYFGKKPSYLDEELLVDGKLFIVKGVISDETKSHLRAELALSRASFNVADHPVIKLGATYLTLRPGTNPNDFKSKLNNDYQKLLPFSFDRIIHFDLQKADEWYFHTADPVYSYITELFVYQSQSKIILVAVVGVAVFLLAIINYIIFFQARIISKSKQVALNKIFGQSKIYLLAHFMADAMLILLLSWAIGTSLVILFGPAIKGLAFVSLNIRDFLSGSSIVASFLFVCLAAILLGLLNLFLVPNMKISENLHGHSGTSIRLRRLVPIVSSIQIIVTATFAVNLFGVMTQMKFIKDYDLGYSYRNIWEVSLGQLGKTDFTALKSHFSTLVGVESSSVCTGNPISGRWFYKDIINDKEVTISQVYCDEDYLNTFKIELLRGRNFDPSNSADTLNLIINETASRQFGLDVDSMFRNSQIIGVVKDFRHNSLKELTSPVFINYKNFSRMGGSQEFRLAIKTDDIQTINKLRGLWLEKFPNSYFDISGFEAEVQRLHKMEMESWTILSLLGFVCAGVTIFSLMGYSYFLVRSRKKDIAIRQIFGASQGAVRYRLFKIVLVQYLPGIIMALGISWYSLSWWLNNYVEHIATSFDIFLIPLLILIVAITLFTSFQIITYTRMNPTVSIKQEF